MDILIIVLIVIAALLVISIIFLTVYLIKNSDKEGETDSIASENLFPTPISSSDEHIKDFYDINSDKDNKVLTFDEFEGEEKTFGADLSGYKPKAEKHNFPEESKPEKSENNFESDNFESKENNFLNNTFDKFENDFKTVSLYEENNIALPEEEDEEDDFDKTQNMEALKPAVSVILKYKDGDADKVIKMVNPTVTVGRGIGNDLLLSHNSFTGRNHGIFTIRDNELYIKDLNSKNGTYINKTQKIEGEVLLSESCTVTFGDAEVKVIIDRKGDSAWR